MKLNNMTVQEPLNQNFKINPIEISKSERTASGRKVKDIIAVKDSFNLTYNGMKHADYIVFYNAFIAGNPVLFEYLDNDVAQIKTVYVTSIPRGIYQEKSAISHSITITLEEV